MIHGLVFTKTFLFAPRYPSLKFGSKFLQRPVVTRQYNRIYRNKIDGNARDTRKNTRKETKLGRYILGREDSKSVWNTGPL